MAAAASSNPGAMQRNNIDIDRYFPGGLERYLRNNGLARNGHIFWDERFGFLPDAHLPLIPMHPYNPNQPEVRAQVEEDDEEQEEEEEEVVEEEEDDEDQNLMRSMNMRIPPPMPAPSQLDTFQHCMKVGFFVASIETLNDRSESNLGELRAFAQAKAEELIDSTGEVRVPEVEGQPICGTPKIRRDLKRMAKHIPYYKDLLEKFIDEFDDSKIRLNKLRRATGFIKGLMTLESVSVYNNTREAPPGNNEIELDIFQTNADLFLKFLEQYTDAEK